MKLNAAKFSRQNFGDDLNFWLWPQLFGNIFDDVPDAHFIGIGSILSGHLERLPGRKLVFGSGYGYGTPPKIDESWTIYFCRGPLTADALNLEPSTYITDGAYALGLLPLEAIRQEEKIYDSSLILHYRCEDEVAWKEIAEDAGLHFISHDLGIEDFMAEVARSRNIVTEAMHGAILADILRIPWTPVVFGDFFLPLKWQDWCSSLDVDFSPLRLPPARQKEISSKEMALRSTKRLVGATGLGKYGWRNAAPFRSTSRDIERLKEALLLAKTREAGFRLSGDTVFDTALNRINEKVESFRQTYVG